MELSLLRLLVLSKNQLKGPVPRKTGSVTMSAASHYFAYHLQKRQFI